MARQSAPPNDPPMIKTVLSTISPCTESMGEEGDAGVAVFTTTEGRLVVEIEGSVDSCRMSNSAAGSSPRGFSLTFGDTFGGGMVPETWRETFGLLCALSALQQISLEGEDIPYGTSATFVKNVTSKWRAQSVSVIGLAVKVETGGGGGS